MNLKRYFFLLFIVVWLSSCNKTDSKDVANEFWAAIVNQDMESAKNLATWDTVDSLKYFKQKKLQPSRFDFGESEVIQDRIEIETMLHSGDVGEQGVRLPGKTILYKSESTWRVDVKKTLSSFVKGGLDNAFEQLNELLQQSIKKLDAGLSDSLKSLGETLKEGSQELEKNLQNLPDKLEPIIPKSPNTQPEYKAI